MPKNIIFYFTGTGNSLKAAKDVAKGLDDCKIVSMTAYKENSFLNEAERIGFVFPVYAGGLPNFVNEFLSGTDFPANKSIYYFMIVTHGGDKGNCIPMMNVVLNKKGIALTFAFDIQMVDNYIVTSDISKDAGDLLKAAQIKIDYAGKMVQAKETTIIQNNNQIEFDAAARKKFFAELDKNYNVSEQCTNCGICVKICPVQNITMENNRPKFNHKCEVCFACLHHCPERAINYEDKTQNKRRYINPDIKLEEIIAGNNRI